MGYPPAGATDSSATSPDGSSAAPVNGAGSYRPGGTSDYVPRNGSGVQASNTWSNAGSNGVTPVGYTQPQ
jgi:hypothetical protein